jgi:arylsulfatase A-like enzyme
VVLLWGGCSSSESELAPRPNIVLITIDTLRSDRVGAYGYARETSPFLDELAAEGVRFAIAYSPSSWTVPSMASLFTSLHPDRHGVQHGLVRRGEIFGQEILDESYVLLAEILRDNGYRTFGVSANLHLAPEFGFGQGFDRYTNLGFAEAARIAPVLDAWSRELRSAPTPFFLWIHFFDPHDPYIPHFPWFETFAPELSGEMGHPDPFWIRRLQKLASTRDRETSTGAFRRELVLAEAAYDAEIRYVDGEIRRTLCALDIEPDDLVIVTSDHGEEFFEHGVLGHSQHLFEEQVRIPLIIRFPAGEYRSRVIDEPVSLVDLLPSLLEYLSIPSPHEVDGRSFLPLLESGVRPAAPVFLSVSRHEPNLRGIRQDRWKYVRELQRPRQGLLYDLEADPGERLNLFSEEQRIRAELSAKLDAFLTDVHTARGPRLQEVGEETLEQLRALGYVD